jgi:hypothetical protein
VPSNRPGYYRDYFRAQGEKRRAYLRERHAADPTKQRDATAKHKAADPAAYLAKKRAQWKRWYDKAMNEPAAKKAYARKRNLKVKFNLTPEDYERMNASQNGQCAICGGPPSRQHKPPVFNVDHCHATGAARALLCNKCNNGLGCFNDRPDLLFAAARYLLHHSVVKDVA